VASTRARRYVGGRIGYLSGPLNVALSYGSSIAADSYFAGTTDDVRSANFGASYDFGAVTLFGELSRVRRERDYAVAPLIPVPDVDFRGYLVGATVPVGPGLIRASYARVKYDMNGNSPVPDPKASKLSLGYVHNLSKRTALYATFARIRNSNGAALAVGGPAFVSTNVFTPRTSSGYDLGIRHAF
jgi:predicted porin